LLRWRESLSHRTPIGSVAGSVNEIGYRIVQIAGRKFLAHRLIIFHQTGRWPTNNIKFKNGNRSDCRWRNIVA
jgi:HNH endonuclease